jgi:septum formation inhibitor MinC
VKRTKTTNEVEQKGAHALFIIVPLNLTLKSTSTSLANDSYLGTLIYHMTLRSGCRIYEKKLSDSQIFLKKK